MEKREFRPYQDSKFDPSVVQPVASRYTDYSIPAQMWLLVLPVICHLVHETYNDVLIMLAVCRICCHAIKFVPKLTCLVHDRMAA
jgi:hypothetical protein